MCNAIKMGAAVVRLMVHALHRVGGRASAKFKASKAQMLLSEASTNSPSSFDAFSKSGSQTLYLASVAATTRRRAKSFASGSVYPCSSLTTAL